MKKNRPTITAHCLVKNEEVYVKAAIMSVIDYIDRIIIFDAGSTDNTIHILKKISQNKKYKDKIHFEIKGDADKGRHTKLRNEMIALTKTDWFMVLDGDEVWPKDQIKFLVENDLQATEKIARDIIICNYHLCSLDLNHYTEKGHYGTPWGVHGQLTARFFKLVKGINWGGEYLSDALYYKNNTKAITQKNVFYSTAYFWHLSKLYRSPKSNLRLDGVKKSYQKFLPKVLTKYFVKKNYLNLPETLDDYI